MLYFYKSISPHPIENLHNYLHNFFIQLFDEVNPTYDHTHHIHADFKEIITKYKTQIDDKLAAIFSAYNVLHLAEKQIVQTAYNNNNNIEGICNKSVKPYIYDDLPISIQPLIRELYDSNGILYKMLTAKDGYSEIKDKCGNLKTHFENFRKQNMYSICPFCGMENILTEYDKLKNEYDHYIPKSEYPFCSINFKNLVPVCDYCNKSGNKGSKDIPFVPKSNPKIQEELYNPYSADFPDHKIVLNIDAKDTDLKDINSWNLEIDCIPSKNSKRKERWMEIYNIESRYKAKIAGDSYIWKERIIKKYNNNCKINGDSFSRFKHDLLEQFEDYLTWNNGIIMNCFNEFILNEANCEAKLSNQITIDNL